jgi:ATP synthase protein I
MSADDDPRESEYVRQVRGKAQRLSRARQREGGFWRHVAHVGSLGFVFVLPLVAGAALGRVVAERTGHPVFALALLLLGLLVGAFGSWRLIRQSFGGDGE